VNHRAQAAIEAVFSTGRRLIDRYPGFRTKNFGDGQDLAFCVSLKGQDVSILAFQFGEFVSRFRFVAGESRAGESEIATIISINRTFRITIPPNDVLAV
jgi:hypothetical protein